MIIACVTIFFISNCSCEFDFYPLFKVWLCCWRILFSPFIRLVHSKYVERYFTGCSCKEFHGLWDSIFFCFFIEFSIDWRSINCGLHLIDLLRILNKCSWVCLIVIMWDWWGSSLPCYWRVSLQQTLHYGACMPKDPCLLVIYTHITKIKVEQITTMSPHKWRQQPPHDSMMICKIKATTFYRIMFWRSTI